MDDISSFSESARPLIALITSLLLSSSMKQVVDQQHIQFPLAMLILDADPCSLKYHRS